MSADGSTGEPATSSPSLPRPPTFDEACEAVLAEPDGDHSPYTTLVPIYDRLLPAERFDEQLRLLTGTVASDADSAIELGCGVGRLLPRLEDRFESVVGLDRRPEPLTLALGRIDRAELIAADAREFDLGRTADAVVAFGGLLSHLHTDADVRAALSAVRDHLGPGDTFVCDAVVDSAAVGAPPATVDGDRYRVRRSVAVEGAMGFPGVDVESEFEVTERGAGAGERGRTATTIAHASVRLFDKDGLRAILREAGFGYVTVSASAGGDGMALCRAVEPRED